MDFGFSSVSRDPSSIPNASDDHGHTPRWTAPEILQPGGASAGTKSDVFSFAMVIYEVNGRTVSEVSAILCVNLGFLREGALPRGRISGGSGNHSEWKASTPANPLQFG